MRRGHFDIGFAFDVEDINFCIHYLTCNSVSRYLQQNNFQWHIFRWKDKYILLFDKRFLSIIDKRDLYELAVVNRDVDYANGYTCVIHDVKHDDPLCFDTYTLRSYYFPDVKRVMNWLEWRYECKLKRYFATADYWRKTMQMAGISVKDLPNNVQEVSCLDDFNVYLGRKSFVFDGTCAVKLD